MKDNLPTARENWGLAAAPHWLEEDSTRGDPHPHEPGSTHAHKQAAAAKRQYWFHRSRNQGRAARDAQQLSCIAGYCPIMGPCSMVSLLSKVQYLLQKTLRGPQSAPEKNDAS